MQLSLLLFLLLFSLLFFAFVHSADTNRTPDTPLNGSTDQNESNEKGEHCFFFVHFERINICQPKWWQNKTDNIFWKIRANVPHV